MERILISALAAALPTGATAPDEIVFLPEGKHKITPQSHPKGIEVNVPAEKGPQIAAALQRDLDKLLARTVQPWFDFEHSRKYPVSGYPKSFRYEAGKGVMVALEWSGKGRRAVEGRDVAYFSPEVYLDKNGIPDGLPDRGPVGGMVTEPAFRDIAPIAAADAGQEQDHHPETMNLLVICGLLTEAEAARENASELARQRVTAMRADASELSDLKTQLAAAKTERDDLKTQLAASEAKVKEAAEKRAEELVTAAIEDGRLAPKDEAKHKQFREKIAAGDAFAEAILAELPKQHEGLDKPLITAGDRAERPAKGGKDGEHRFMTEARKLVTAKQAEDLDEAQSIVASENPELYEEYRQSL